MCRFATSTYNFSLKPIDSRAGRNRPCKNSPPISHASHNWPWKKCEDNCLSYPPWRDFGPLTVLLLLRTNKPMRMDFLSISLEDFRSPRETVFSSHRSAELAGFWIRWIRYLWIRWIRCLPLPSLSSGILIIKSAFLHTNEVPSSILMKCVPPY